MENKDFKKITSTITINNIKININSTFTNQKKLYDIYYKIADTSLKEKNLYCRHEKMSLL